MPHSTSRPDEPDSAQPTAHSAGAAIRGPSERVRVTPKTGTALPSAGPTFAHPQTGRCPKLCEISGLEVAGGRRMLMQDGEPVGRVALLDRQIRLHNQPADARRSGCRGHGRQGGGLPEVSGLAQIASAPAVLS